MLLMQQVERECALVVTEENHEEWQILLQPNVFYDHCPDLCEAELKDSNRKTGSLHLCDYTVRPILLQLKIQPDEEYAEKMSEDMLWFARKWSDDPRIQFLRQNPELKARVANGLGTAIFRAGSNKVFRDTVCKVMTTPVAAGLEFSAGASCSTTIGTLLKRAGMTTAVSPFTVAAATEGIIVIWAASSAFKQEKLTLAEMELQMIEGTAAAVGGGLGSAAGFWIGSSLAAALCPGATTVSYGLGWLSSYLGYTMGRKTVKMMLDELFGGTLSELDRVRRCRALLDVSKSATATELKVAWRIYSKTSHPDHGGSTDSQLEANVCLAILLENNDKDAMPFFEDLRTKVFPQP